MKKVPNEGKLIYILLEKQKYYYFKTLIYIVFFNLLFIPLSSVKLHVCHENFYKKSGNALFETGSSCIRE